MASQPSLGDELYSGAASFGQIKALIGAIIGTIIGIIMIGFGISLSLKKQPSFESVNATILNVNCNTVRNTQNGQNSTTQNCNINVSYNYNGKNQNKYIQYTGNQVYVVNQQITVYVNKDNDSEIYLDIPNSRTLGLLLLFIGLLILIGSWFVYWLSNRYKFFAAAQGVSGAYNLFRN
jgi:hypothetical protein